MISRISRVGIKVATCIPKKLKGFNSFNKTTFGFNKFKKGEKMKQKKREKKLWLGKVTIQDLNTVLDRDEQRTAKGGTKDEPWGTTAVPIYCKP